MTILADAKQAIRQNGSGADTEVTDLIAAAKKDLALSGVTMLEDTDALIKRAILLYCKANYGYDNPDAARFQELYDSLKTHLASSGDYSAFAVTFSVTAGGSLVDEAEITFNDIAKKTGAAGTVVFYVISGLNYEYRISRQGYATQESNIDISANTTVSIALVVG